MTISSTEAIRIECTFYSLTSFASLSVSHIYIWKQLLIDVSHMENTPSHKTAALTKSLNMVGI